MRPRATCACCQRVPVVGTVVCWLKVKVGSSRPGICCCPRCVAVVVTTVIVVWARTCCMLGTSVMVAEGPNCGQRASSPPPSRARAARRSKAVGTSQRTGPRCLGETGGVAFEGAGADAAARGSSGSSCGGNAASASSLSTVPSTAPSSRRSSAAPGGKSTARPSGRRSSVSPPGLCCLLCLGVGLRGAAFVFLVRFFLLCELLSNECFYLLFQALVMLCHCGFSFLWLLLGGGGHKLPDALDVLVQKDKV